jgi:hypothetical protein
MTNTIEIIDVPAFELSKAIGHHFGFRGFDMLYSLRPCSDQYIEFFAGDWIHPVVGHRVDAIRNGNLSTDIELLLRLMVKDGVIDKGVYRVDTQH